MSSYLLKSSKKAQIKMFESVMVLICFFFLLALAMNFYGSVEKSNLISMQQKFNTFDAIKMSILISNLPELKCSLQGVQKSACVDKYKMQIMCQQQAAASQLVTDMYFDYFAFSTIELVYVRGLEDYSVFDERQEYICGNNGNDHIITIYNRIPQTTYSTSTTGIPVVVWDPTSRLYELAMLYIKVHHSEN